MRDPLLAVCFGLLVACGPKPPQGPQPTGVTSRAYVGDAELEVRYRYEVSGDKNIILFVDAASKKGAVGAIEVRIVAKGFAVVSGEKSWKVNPTGEVQTHELTLRANDKTPTVDIVTRHRDKDIELAADTLRFITDDWVRECQPTDEACG